MRIPGARPGVCVSGKRAAVALVAMLQRAAGVRTEDADAKMFSFIEWQE